MNTYFYYRVNYLVTKNFICFDFNAELNVSIECFSPEVKYN